MMSWPPLPLDAWRPTRDTLHRYSQIVGKVQLALTPRVNHFWNAALQVTARGLATPALRQAGRSCDIELDLVDHRACIRTSDGRDAELDLRPMSVAEFHRELLSMLDSLGFSVEIWDHPVEIPTEAIPFSLDRVHVTYDRDHATRFFQVLAGACEIIEQFRARFIGKCSGVGFYWGTFDLGCARYSGRRAMGPALGSAVEREAFSHELSEVGFWTGDAAFGAPAFYAMHYPAPDGYQAAPVRPSAAFWAAPSRCFVLPYDACRDGDLPAQVLEFFQSTYEAGATRAGWPRAELEREEPVEPLPAAAHH